MIGLPNPFGELLFNGNGFSLVTLKHFFSRCFSSAAKRYARVSAPQPRFMNKLILLDIASVNT